MKVSEFKIKGPKLLEIKSFRDDRGFFTERFKSQDFKDAGIACDFVQDNFSHSAAGVLRGLHYQFDKPQGKLFTVTRGKCLDVIVDIRKSSPTLGESITVEFSGDEPKWLYIPPGFAHGFCVLGSESADVFYKVDAYYNGSGEGGIRWNDPDLGIVWPLARPLVSAKDSALPTFADYLKVPGYFPGN